MASRKEQKEAAKAARLAAEQARAEAARRSRIVRLGGVLGIAIVAVVILVVISSSGGGKSASAKASAAKAAAVNALLVGIPQSGTTLGSPTATVTVTEYGDLECPFCADFAKGAENNLIATDVRSGKVKLIYKSLETATQDPTIFSTQQAAAYAAGAQDRALNFIELFYNEQGEENSGYVTAGYLDGLAKQIPGLNYSKWLAASKATTYSNAVLADQQAAGRAGYNSTPTIVVSGPKGSNPITSSTIDYATLESAINAVA
ncbi:MAG TPA: thioredoxin domain-containing protein [Solirubrobacteraceae bacterium]|jgi:protein-disulfide isomerase|nr:thioredoxin domain-containing protein [Solirubrobacteraceae bacterium]